MDPAEYAAVDQARTLCAEHDCELLYLTKSGSHLYGTNTENSDNDYIGLYLQNPNKVLVGDRQNHIVRTTGGDHEKNTKDDVDITLWNVTYWLKTLLSRGDTGALDLFYAIHNKVNVLFDWNEEGYWFSDTLNTKRPIFFDPLNAKSFVGYATTQANQYGIKGERLATLKAVHNWLQENRTLCDDSVMTLDGYIATLIHKFGHEKYFCAEQSNNIPSVRLLGKVSMGTITMCEFRDRVVTLYEKYGNRAHAAAKASGVDWKALSHAVRVLFEYIVLLQHGYIKFPLPELERAFVLSVKQGTADYEHVQGVLNNLFDVIEALEPCEAAQKMKYNQEAVDEKILGFYRKIW